MKKQTLIDIHEFVKHAHKGQVDKGGNDYFTNHILQVVKNVGQDRTLKAIAYLHDIVEDTNISLDYVDFVLRFYGVGLYERKRIMKAVDILTKKCGINYATYINTVACNKDAMLVKIADMKSNCDLTRLPVVTQKDIDRTEKYKKTLEWFGW